jgi:ribonuclease-3
MTAAEEIEDVIGYHFSDAALRDQALTHPSFSAEHPEADHYERLEFLGDAVLELATTQYLYATMSGATEGEMTLVRAAVVAEPALARIGRDWGVPAAIKLGRGEGLSGGQEKDSIISDVVEALLGAVYLEAGYERVEEIVTRHWSELADQRATAPGHRDYKTRLQEILVASGRQVRYLVSDDGPQHAKEFTATAVSDGDELATGTGSSKKRAEQEAARLALERLSGS